MCGIVGAVAQRDVAPILLEGLKRLEYRGYDSAGVAILSNSPEFRRARVKGKVKELEALLEQEPLPGGTGIAHTRWATHGEPSTRNAHPHVSRGLVALVHNGIIENHEALRAALKSRGSEFDSETDTEVVVHAVGERMAAGEDLLSALRAVLPELHGAYALAVIAANEPGRLVVARRGSPLVIGYGIGEHFVASDVFALLPVTQRFTFLEDGDVAEITRQSVRIYDAQGQVVERPQRVSQLSPDAVEKAGFRHFMLKEIHGQPKALSDTLDGRLRDGRVMDEAFGQAAAGVFDRVEQVQIVACGTSFHAGSVARYWLEGLAGIPTSVEVASEFRYREVIARPNTLFVSISQSGETADTLAAQREARRVGFSNTLAICNVPESSLTRESDLVFMTRAGPEIGVASTKAFTTQLVGLLLLTLCLKRRRRPDAVEEARMVALLESIPGRVNVALELDAEIARLAEEFSHRHHALYLGRGPLYPVAMEGALKLKEISYIHAEAYPAGELKHGPLALVDEDMPVVAVAPNNALLEKLKSNLEEVRARGGKLYVFAEAGVSVSTATDMRCLTLAPVDDLIAPIVYTVPLQLLAYHVAVLKGADVDQPRNLAKSVTVE